MGVPPALRHPASQADVLDVSAPRLPETPSQTAGPYVHIGAMPRFAGLRGAKGTDLGSTMRGPGTRGEAVTLCGTIRDGTGALVRDALVECWQADAEGRFAGQEGADRAFSGFGRSACDAEAIASLVAPLDMEAAIPMDSLAYRFDIVLRGRHQTAFENRPEGL